ncbi:MAG TPA: flagellar hook-associated protein FlgK [Xanthobacteraceae bacterium]|nr:flagellar hook-associated protein FlgK [Xanthobacteraceae bacterium]
MSLSQALFSAMSGLRANQSAMSLLSSNIANTETPGYVRKTVNQVATSNGGIGSGVLVVGVNRELDQYVQGQLRVEMAGASYANTKAAFLDSLQGIYGNPGSAGTIEASFNNFIAALQGLSTSSDSASARIAAVNSAQILAQQLSASSQDIQTLRSNADSAINDSVMIANNAMKQIADINGQLRRGGASDGATAELLDQRDRYIDQLAQLMDIKVVANEGNQVTVFTSSGVQLVGTQAAVLTFNSAGTVAPDAQWDPDPAKSSLSSITIQYPNTSTIDLVASHAIRSGKIAALLELRDNTLVQAQAQLDQLAAMMASALSDKTMAGTPVSTGTQDGFDVDLAGMLSGNIVHLTFTDGANQKQNISIIRVDDPSVLPLPNSATNDPNDRVIGIDFSGDVIAQLTAALGSEGLEFSISGSTLSILNAAGGPAVVNGASVTTTVSTLTNGDVQLPLFTDGGRPYSGAFTANGPQQLGLAARIMVNPAIVNDPGLMVIYNTSPLTPSGDTERPDFILKQLTSGLYTYSPATGIGSNSAPFKGTLLTYTQQMMSMQGDAAMSAMQLATGQNVVLNALQQKMEATAGVDIDREMAHLLALQNAYAANARVMASIKDMYDMLMRVV